MTVASAAIAGTGIRTLGDAEFRFLSGFVQEHCGITMGEHKRPLLQGRLQRRLRALELESFGDYCELLRRDPDSELGAFVSAVSTNVTAFFREPHHFEYLGGQLSGWLGERPRRRLRIWSAGCATGEEAYSLAMVLAEAMDAEHGAVDALILATDLSPAALETARRGVYPLERLGGVSPERRHRWFQRGSGAQAGFARVHPRLTELVRVRPLNLMEPWPMHGTFDAIFCRNVVIYFDAPARKRLFERFHGALQPEGKLFLGHSESMHGLSERFKLVGQTIYTKGPY
ncbi:MAG TPA: protein-glutamate O-methyltransferase CheR [Rhodanobacteraceae bacterium]|nr:protein-glutamate O-methyltransferase CheR [Rhodanobacteraceae bacterium]